MSETITIITVDGPSGSGKGTISQLLAKKLNFHFLDSGSLYRVLALAVHEQALAFEDDVAIAQLALQLKLKFTIKNETLQIFLADRNISDAIRGEAIGVIASKIAIYPKVRKNLLKYQQDFLQKPGLVADGRDMGTVVFPQAKYKFFLSASLEARALRRFKQLKEKGQSMPYETILEDLSARDYRDKERKASPLVPAEDAIKIDTTNKNIQQVFAEIYSYITQN